jgi:hypothetical protein
MKQRLSFLLAAVVTGFLLVALGGVAGNILGASASGGSGSAENAAAPAPTEDLIAVMQQREATYRQMIADANARIEQLQAAPAPAEAAQPEAPAYPVTPDQAAERAILFAGGTLMQTPELVNVQGTVAYEVVLSGGTFYVNATTGGILMPRVETVTISNSSGRGGEHEEHEHEGGDD